MKRLVRNILFLTSPLLVLFLFFVILDPFSIIHTSMEGCKSNSQEAYDVSKMRILQTKDLSCYNSFVFGNSRANAFDAKEWSEKIGTDSILNLSSPGENITHIKNKIDYLIKHGALLENILFVLDDNIFRNYDESYLIGPVYLHHSISRDGNCINNILAGFGFFLEDFYFVKYFAACFSFNGDFNSFIQLRSASNIYQYNQYLEYKKVRLDLVPNSDAIFNFEKVVENSVEIETEDKHALKGIKAILERNDTKYRIVIGPYFNNSSFSDDLRNTISQIFGERNFFDFSKEEKYKYNTRFWDDDIHFSQQVGTIMLDSLYRK